jgi:hypothetical protein
MSDAASELEDIAMTDMQLTLSLPERDCLAKVLESALKNDRVREHRTRAPSYREYILEEEKLLEQVLIKLGQPTK